VSDRRWFWPKVSAEYSAKYSAETEYSVPPAETESQNSAFLNIQSTKIVKKSMQIIDKSSNILEEIQIKFNDWVSHEDSAAFKFVKKRSQILHSLFQF
jgi:capsular polysaccharide biosynthesis protein